MDISFKKAQPVWEKGHETDINETLVFRYVIENRKKSVLRITGSSVYNIGRCGMCWNSTNIRIRSIIGVPHI